jgi:tetratricopeptide (TPR) repeat protein
MSRHPRLKNVLAAIFLVASTCLVYLPSLSGGFVLDDELLLSKNALVFAPDGLWRMWFSTDAVDYWPLTNTSFWLEWRLWGDKPSGYHVTNLVLHITSVLLLWLILRRLAVPGAFLAALLFAIHPVNVESVAWIAQRKNGLAMLFFLVSIWSYLKFDPVAGASDSVAGVSDPGEAPHGSASVRPATDRRPTTSWIWYSCCAAAFILALLSKASVAVLPALVLVIVWWQKGRIAWRDFWPLVPLFAIAIAFALFNVWYQQHGGRSIERDVTFAQRLAGAPAAVWFYLSKAMLPIEQVFIYPQWQISTGDWRWWAAMGAALAATAALWWNAASPWGRAVLAAWLFFCIALAPVVGLVDVGFMKHSLVADHYQHVAIIAVVVLAAVAWSYWKEGSGNWEVGQAFQPDSFPTRQPGKANLRARRFVPVMFATAVCAAFFIATWRQNVLFGDPIRLYLTTLEANPDSWLAHNNLGAIYYEAGEAEKALPHLQDTVRLNPKYAEGHNNLALALARIGNVDQALAEYQRAVELDPNDADAQNNWGAALVQSNRLPEAAKHFEQALKLMPDWVVPRFNLGLNLVKQNKLDDAIREFREALRIMPENLDVRLQLYNALLKTGRLAEAEGEEREIRRLQSALIPESFTNAEESFTAGKLQEAIQQYREAIEQSPDYAPAHAGLALALGKSGTLGEAIEEFKRAATLAPQEPRSHLNLALALAQAGKYTEAVDHFRRAIQLSPNDIDARMQLAMLYARTNKPDKAIETAEAALTRAEEVGDEVNSAAISSWLQSFRSSGDGRRRVRGS